MSSLSFVRKYVHTRLESQVLELEQGSMHPEKNETLEDFIFRFIRYTHLYMEILDNFAYIVLILTVVTRHTNPNRDVLHMLL